jgi:hypothetical protein
MFSVVMKHVTVLLNNNNKQVTFLAPDILVQYKQLVQNIQSCMFYGVAL